MKLKGVEEPCSHRSEVPGEIARDKLLAIVRVCVHAFTWMWAMNEMLPPTAKTEVENLTHTGFYNVSPTSLQKSKTGMASVT